MARAMKDSGIEWIGEIPKTYSIMRVKHIGNCRNGLTYSPNDVVDEDHGTLVIRSSNIKNGKLCFEDNVYVNLNIPASLMLQEGDIIICSRNGSKELIGKCALVEDNLKASFGAFMMVFRCDAPQYMYFVLNSSIFKYYLNSFLTATINQLTGSNLLNMSIVWCDDKTEQKKIVNFLSLECARIDKVIEQTRASIEEYKKLKQAVITEAVTKGIRPRRKMKDSGVEWIGEIPEEWPIFRIANLYDERNENGSEDLPILTVSINTGISDHEIPDDEKSRVFVRSEDRTLYKRVCPGDLAYNMMRAWQGAFGAVRVDGMVSPAYVVAKPKTAGVLDSRYVEALLRTPSAIEEMHRYSRGITDFRLRLYWPEFKNIRICVPPLEEQIEIADCIDTKSAEIETLIFMKQRVLDELEAYKKSMIFEYVTGKKEL